MLVRKQNSEFGENAGKIWHAISTKGSQSIEDIAKNTNLNTVELHAGIGWLARENKIKKDSNNYSLDDTNLTNDIGSTAGKVYKILDIWEEADIDTLEKLSAENTDNIYSALGWLAREDKIQYDSEKKYSLNR